MDFRAVSHEGGCQGSLVNGRNELHMFVTDGFLAYSVDLWKMEFEKWTKVLPVPHIAQIPVSLWCDVTYMLSTNKWLMMTEWSDVYEFDMQMKELHSFFPIKYFYALKGSVYTESIISSNP
ncbi:hypothetical protein L1987_85132 [Smallanthus sonchifolius]|uniref:Uncharacterized protein n=1 Tax=Smallanthus sonchifolius TaxID=185202 RepID=A0ACB8XV54_9ASTR|nr:hypothetical protein L1987_85132 [Smallanthus sonchifolius]